MNPIFPIVFNKVTHALAWLGLAALLLGIMLVFDREVYADHTDSCGLYFQSSYVTLRWNCEPSLAASIAARVNPKR